MPRLFGRNNPEVDPKTAYRMESDRVMQAVTYQEIGAVEHWADFTSVFQETAFKGIYGDILEDLARIESKVVFDDRN